MRPMPARLVPVGLAVAAVAMAGCSSAKKTAASTPPSTPPTSASTTASASPTESTSSAPAVTAKLTAIALQATDVPAGFRGTPAEPDPAEAAGQAQLAACLGVRNTYPDRSGSVQSKDFARGDATISSQVNGFRSRDAVDSDIAMLKKPKIDSCYTKLVRAELATSLPSGSTVDALSVHLTPGAGGGPGNVAGLVSAKLTVTVSGQTADVFIDTALISGPRIEAEVDFENVGARVPASVRTPVIAKVAARAAHA